MTITERVCAICNKSFQHFRGAALPDERYCSQCAQGTIVVQNTEILNNQHRD